MPRLWISSMVFCHIVMLPKCLSRSVKSSGYDVALAEGSRRWELGIWELTEYASALHGWLMNGEPAM